MRLTRIEVHGFKSFADRTQLDFPPGLTAIVGPNGCGKSNVIDSIKWALGEQRPTALRGDEMLDVIFKGNGARPARNFAEVSLVFDNAEGVLPVEYAEVVVSRRLFRSGESEYLINRQPARLKDVRNLFLDTGLGTGTYSIMEQGRIDAILSANPVDRRRIFEEAAGISRYRSRRRECESKLERTEQNLLRLGDVVDELEKRSRSLKYQAGRARSYERTRRRMRELKALFYTHRWQELGGELARLAAEEAGRADDERRARSALEQERSGMGALGGLLEQARAQVDAVAAAFGKASAAVDALGEREAATREQLEELRLRQQSAGDRARGLEIAVAERRRESQELQERLAGTRGELETAQARLTSGQQELAAARTGLERWQELSQQRRAAALGRQAELTGARNLTAELRSRRAGLAASRERLGERAGALAAELESQQLAQGELFAGARDLEASLEQARGQLERRRAACDASAAQAERLDTELASRRERLAAVTSRREAIEELIARREGLSPGAVTLLESGLAGVEGLVIDHLHVPRELVDAVEVALGSSAEAVLVASRADALAALAFLRDEHAGRVLLLPRDAVRPRGSAAGGERLLDRLGVTGGEQVEHVVEALLGHVRLVADRDAFGGCELDGHTVYVTPAGEMLDERGVLRVGRAADEDGHVARRTECEALSAEEAELTRRLEELTLERGRRADELLGLQAELEETDRRVRRLESERERHAERSEQARERREVLQRDLALVENDLRGLDGELAATDAELSSAAAREEDLLARVGDDEADAARHGEERAALEAAVAARDEVLAGARVEASQLRERVDAQLAEQRQVEQRLAERDAELTRAREELAALEGRREELGRQLSELRERAAALAEERDARAGELDAARAATAELADRVKASQAGLETLQAVLDRANEALSAARMSSSEVRIHRDGLREKVLEELEVDLASCDPGALLATLTPADDADEVDEADEADEAGDGTDVQAAAESCADGEAAAAGTAQQGGDAGGDAAGASEGHADGDAVERATGPADPSATASDAPAGTASSAAAAGAAPTLADLASYDWAQVEREIEVLRDRLARMGNVNLAAIDELAEVEERLGFLTGQRDDLVEAKRSLLDTIGRVNRESRERFTAAFEEVREHFRVIFRKLFQGGRADIMLEEGADVLDAGIDIVAAPPGKDQRSISLLSGGERTLTAVGLLFALFRARPSPVCMLDEVDAALDETNIDRFCRVLEDFLGKSQFLVVTHARRTMSYADTLYGVTMQEHGVSRVLSLTLAEYEQARHGAEESAARRDAGGGSRGGRRRATGDGGGDGDGEGDGGAADSTEREGGGRAARRAVPAEVTAQAATASSAGELEQGA